MKIASIGQSEPSTQGLSWMESWVLLSQPCCSTAVGRPASLSPPDDAGAQPVADQDLTDALLPCKARAGDALLPTGSAGFSLYCLWSTWVVSGTEIQSDSLDRGWRSTYFWYMKSSYGLGSRQLLKSVSIQKVTKIVWLKVFQSK